VLKTAAGDELDGEWKFGKLCGEAQISYADGVVYRCVASVQRSQLLKALRNCSVLLSGAAACAAKLWFLCAL
jgi:hypothetical protein